MAKQIAMEIGDRLGYQYKIYLADDEQLEQDYYSAYERGLKNGITPIMVASSSNMLDLIIEYQNASPNYAANLIKAADEIDIAPFFQKKATLLEQFDHDGIEDAEEIFAEIEGGYHFNTLDPDSADLFLLMEIPHCEPWMLPAYFPMSGFNDCPLPELQIAIFKMWFETYGAIPAIVHEDMWESWLPNRLDSSTDFPNLAIEHYLFAPDIVDQGVESVEFLAEILKRSKNWFFYWD